MFFKYLNLILFKIKNKFLLKKHQKNFKSYEELVKFCNKINENSYNNNYLNEFRLKAFLNSFDKIENKFQSSFKLLLEAISIHIIEHKKLPKILDVGGGYGDGFLYTRKIFKNSIINYSIVETEKVCELSKKINFKNETNQKIQFFKNLDEALRDDNYDLIFSSGTLQYFKNPYELLEKINSSNAKIIALTRNAFSLNDQLISQMTYLYSNGSVDNNFENYKNQIILYPHQSIDEEKLIKILNNYYVEFSKDFYKMKNIKNHYSKDILFKIKISKSI